MLDFEPSKRYIKNERQRKLSLSRTAQEFWSGKKNLGLVAQCSHGIIFGFGCPIGGPIERNA